MQDRHPNDEENLINSEKETLGEETEPQIIDVDFTDEEESERQTEPLDMASLADTTSNHSYYHETIKPQSPPKNKSFTKFIIGILIVSIVGGASIGAGFAIATPLVNQLGTKSVDDEIEKTSEISTSYVQPINVNNSIADIADNVGPSVVSIKNNKTVATWAGEFTQSGLGSGVIFKEDEEKFYIISNAHVVEGATTLSVTFLGNEKAQASLVGVDTISDIAVIAVNKVDIPEEIKGDIQLAPIGNSDHLRVGDLAVAIGNPVDEAYNNTVTVGVISALDREINLTDQKLKLIQTDAAINPGNSGGALVGPTGEVIGINTVKLVDSQIEGMGFALPINDVMPIVNELMEKGRIIRPSLGITGQDLTEEIGNFYEIPVGILVVHVLPGSSAELAGIKQGDIILEFNEQKISTIEELKQLLLTQKVGDTITIKLIRGSSKHNLEVKLQEMPQSYR